MAFNLIDEYKKKLSSFGQGLTGALSEAPIPYIASKVAPSIQNTFNAAGKEIGNFIRPTVSPLPSNRFQSLTDPIRNIVGQTAEDVVKDLPTVGASMLRSSPPVQLGKQLQGLAEPQKQQEITGQRMNDAYNGVRGVGYMATPGANILGGLVGLGTGMVTNALDNKPLFDEYAKNFSQGYGQSAQFSALGAINPLFAKELSNPILSGVGRPLSGELLKRAAMAGARSALESGAMGFLQPDTKDRIKNAEDQAVFGAVTGALGQSAGDLGGIAVEKLAKQLGVAASSIQGWIKHLNTPVATTDVDPRTGKRLVVPMWKYYTGYGEKGGFIDFGAEVSNPMAGETKSPMLPESSSRKILNQPPQESISQEMVAANPSTTSEAVQQGQELLQGGLSGQTSQGGSGLPPKGALSLPGSIPQKDTNTFLSGIESKINKLYTEAIDRFHPLSKIAKNAGEDQAMRNALTGYYGTGSIGQYHIDFELKPILREHDVGDLRSAAIAMRDLELAKRGIRGSNLAEDIQALSGNQKLDSQSANALGTLQKLQEKLGPEKMKSLGETLNKLYSYQDAMTRKYLVDTGIMSKDAYAAMKQKNQFYVPFKRVMDQVDEFLGMAPGKGAGSISSQDVVKGIKGSDKAIQDPLESIVESTYKMVGLAKRQEVAKTLVNLAPKLPEGTITKINGPVGNRSSISLFENGKVQHYAVPPEIADAAKGLSEEGLNTMIKILAYPTKIFRASATGMNPEFMAPNVVRDLQSAFVNTGLNPLQWVRGLAHQIKRDDVYQEFLKSGGLNSRVALDRSMLRNTVEDVTRKGLELPNPGSIKHIIEALGEYSEQPTRIAMFESALKKGIKQGLDPQEAAIRAANSAQEGTVNFARRGSKTQSINAIYAFLNARVQGIDRLIRTVKNDPKGASLRIGMATAAPAVALYAHNRGYQSYNDPRVVSQSDKDSNFIIMLSDTPIEQLGGAQYIKIPKGEIGKLANPIETFMSFADGKGGDVQASLLGALKGFMPIDNAGDIIPTALRPPVENAANRSFFSGQEIVPNYKKNYPAGYQSTSYTSPVYRAIGEKIGISPAQIQNIVEGYATGWAKIGSTVANPLIPEKYKSEKNIQGQTINKTPLLRRFIGGEKRTPEEQQAIDQKKQESIKFQVNDIKGGINRGDIPTDVGIKQIQNLENNPNAQYYVGSDGKLKTADLSPIPQPQLTGQTEVDQLLLKDYSTAINKKVSDIVGLNTAGKLDDTKASQMIRDLELERFKASTRAGTKTQVRSFEQIKKSKDISSVNSEQTQALKDFQDNKISATDLSMKLKAIKVKKIKLGGGKKPKKIKLPKIKKPKKIKVKKIKLKKT